MRVRSSGWRQAGRRGAALAALVGLLGGQAPGVAAGLDGSPRQPVVMVSDLWGGEASLGVPGPGRRAGGLYAALRSRGYVPGRTMFWVVLGPDGDLLGAAEEALPAAVRRALLRSGAQRVDMVALGAGAVAARLYVERWGGHRFVDSLVMVRPPLRGSLALTWYRDLGLIEAATRARRASGRGRGQELVLGAARAPFSSELAYLDEVAYRFFEPLYGEFVAEAAETPPGRRALPLTFAAWFRRTYPADHRAAFGAAALPPLLEDDPRGPVPPSREPGRALSRAHFNAVALEVARHNYRQFEPWLRVAASGWERDLVWEGDWRTTLAEFLLRRAAALAEEWLRRKGPELGRQIALAGVGALSGVTALDPSLHHLVAEERILPGEPDGGRPFVANAALRSLNLAAASRERGEGPGRVRYVSVVGVPPRWLTFLLSPEARYLVQRQLEEQLLAPGLLDEVVLDTGLAPLAGAGAIGVGERTWSAVADRLEMGVQTGPRVRRQAGPGGTELLEGGGIARAREPWLAVLEPAPAEEAGAAALARASGAGRREVRVEPLAPPPPGFRFVPFLVLADKGGIARVVPLKEEVGGGGGSRWRASLPGGQREGRSGLLLGARLIPAEGPEGQSALLAAGRALAFRYRLEVVPDSGGGLRDRPARPPRGADGGAGRRAPTGPGRAGHRGAARGDDGQPSAAPGPQGQARGAAEAPEGGEDVVATYRNKHTSLLKEDRTYHVRWEWDFGDGTAWSDGDPAHVVSTVTHAFRPGVYRVRARSWSNKGTILREVEMTVRVGKGGAEVTLSTGRSSAVRGEGRARGSQGGVPAGERLTPAGEGGDPASRGETSALPAGPAGPAGGEGSEALVLVAETAREPPVRLELVGPRAWVTGRAAGFRVSARVDPVPFLEEVQVDYDPAPAFSVRWRKPGTFRVQGAARVTLVYRFPEGELRLRNVYVVERQVEVYAPSVTR